MIYWIIGGVAYLVGGLITVGAILAESGKRWPSIADETFKEDLAFGIFYAFFLPVVSWVVVLFVTGFYQYGVSFHGPSYYKKKAEESKKLEPMKPEQVKCETCKHWVDKADCQTVHYTDFWGMTSSYYCPIHNLPYDSKINLGGMIKYFKTIPAHEEEVTETGEPVKGRKNK